MSHAVTPAAIRSSDVSPVATANAMAPQVSALTTGISGLAPGSPGVPACAEPRSVAASDVMSVSDSHRLPHLTINVPVICVGCTSHRK